MHFLSFQEPGRLLAQDLVIGNSYFASALHLHEHKMLWKPQWHWQHNSFHVIYAM